MARKKAASLSGMALARRIVNMERAIGTQAVCMEGPSMGWSHEQTAFALGIAHAGTVWKKILEAEDKADLESAVALAMEEAEDFAYGEEVTEIAGRQLVFQFGPDGGVRQDL